MEITTNEMYLILIVLALITLLGGVGGHLIHIEKERHIKKLKHRLESRKLTYRDIMKPYSKKDIVDHVVTTYIVPKNFRLLANRPLTRMVIHYYKQDHVFTTDAGVLIDDPHYMLGPHVHLLFGIDNPDPNSVCVFDENISTVYEVTQYHCSYKDSILRNFYKN